MTDNLFPQKLLRNHVFDQGFIMPDKVTMVRKKDLLDLHDWVTEGAKGPHEHRPHYQLSSRHLNCYGAERQRVVLACQVVSKKTAEALKMFDPSKTPQADFLELFNKW